MTTFYIKQLSTLLRDTARAVVILTAAFSVIGAPTPAAAQAADGASITTSAGQIVIIKIFTNLLRPLRPQDYERDIDIYLPYDYIHGTDKNQRFPVVYLLHGSPGNPYDFVKHGHWQIFSEQAATANNFVAPILVAPDGNYAEAAFGDSEWLNSADSLNRFEDFVVDQVVPYIDQHYRTIATPDGRVIGGVSEGGYGAVNIALHDPAVFGSVIALSGYYTNDGSGWARRIMGHNKEFLEYNSPIAFVDNPDAQAKYLQIWKTQHYFIGSGLDEKRYTVQSKQIADLLRQHNIPVSLCQLNGKHSWELWNSLFIAGLTDVFSPNHASATDQSQLPTL